MCLGKEDLPEIHRSMQRRHDVHASHICKCQSTNHRCDSQSNTHFRCTCSALRFTKEISNYPRLCRPFSLFFGTQHAPTVVVRISETPCIGRIFYVDNIARNTENVVKYNIITVNSTPHNASEIRGALMDTLHSSSA